MPYSNRVLVIDDRQEDGEAIARRLWQDQVPNCFVRYDEDTLQSIKNTFHGIRIVFQDIKLIPGTGFPNNADYGAAAQILDSLLKETNGPWLMVAWSTWAEDPDHDHMYAQELFDYLSQRLPIGKKPRSFLVLDKKPYTSDGNHAEVKSEGELGDEEKKNLLDSVREFYDQSAPISTLSQWERDVGGCASSVVNELWGLTEGLHGLRDDELTGLLLRLAKSQDGRVGNDIAEALHEILSSLLVDRLAYSVSGPIELESKEYSGDTSKMNTMLHWDGVEHENVNAPGAIYVFPDDGSARKYFFAPEPEVGKLKEFIYANFIGNNGDNGKSIKEADKDEHFSENIKLVMLDATPPCDHDNAKAIWRKMVFGVEVLSNDSTGMYLKHVRTIEYLRKTPIFSIGGQKKYFIYNSNLIVSIPDDDALLKELDYIGRIREQLLRDFVSWLGGMMTRPGIVSVH